MRRRTFGARIPRSTSSLTIPQDARSLSPIHCPRHFTGSTRRRKSPMYTLLSTRTQNLSALGLSILPRGLRCGRDAHAPLKKQYLLRSTMNNPRSSSAFLGDLCGLAVNPSSKIRRCGPHRPTGDRCRFFMRPPNHQFLMSNHSSPLRSLATFAAWRYIPL